MPRIKSCLHCGQPFFGRRDAKTCSTRCRKGLQRNRALLANGSQPNSSQRRFTEMSQSDSTGTSVVARPASARRPKQSGRLKHLAVVLLGSVLLGIAALGHSASAAVSQGYVTDDKDLRQYMAVSLSGDNYQGHPVVQSSSINQAGGALGVVVGLGDSLLTVAPLSSQVYVVNSGPSKAYVSDINGTPKKGDTLTLSPLRGILMKADATGNSAGVFGRALKNFNLSGSQVIKAQDSNGKSIMTHVAVMNIEISINPVLSATSEQSTNWLSNLGANITGHQISSVRVLAALAIFFTLMVIEGEIIYSTVSTSITAMGRNPLARKSISRQSMHSAGVAGVILMAGIGVIAMLVWA
jgi:hypothetical protein